MIVAAEACLTRGDNFFAAPTSLFQASACSAWYKVFQYCNTGVLNDRLSDYTCMRPRSSSGPAGSAAPPSGARAAICPGAANGAKVARESDWCTIDRKSTMPMLANVFLRTQGKNQLLVAATDLSVSTTAELKSHNAAGGGLTLSGKNLHLQRLPEFVGCAAGSPASMGGGRLFPSWMRGPILTSAIAAVAAVACAPAAAPQRFPAKPPRCVLETIGGLPQRPYIELETFNLPSPETMRRVLDIVQERACRDGADAIYAPKAGRVYSYAIALKWE